MAPILKEVEAPVVTATTTASANVSAAPHPKAPADAPSRPQPVALEIPVTVNGARTVDGSDKREPFSESSQTVLVFPLGAVIRITTPLAPGQLVFLTNEKTKKEVVCQVVKSKSAGSGSNYVELQFTESANGFWGLLVPSSPAAPAVPRPVAPAAPAVPKAISPAAPVAAKPTLPKPVAPAANLSAPAKPVLPLPPSPAVSPEPAAPQSAAPITPAPPVGAAPPFVTPVPELLKPQPTSPPVDVAPKLEAAPQIPHMPHPAKPVVPALPLRDFSKEIDALFAVPQAPESKPTSTTNAEPISTASSSPSSEELKHQTARLQEQLSSLLFTETPAAPSPASVAPETPKKESPAADVAKKILEIAQEQPKPAVKHEPAVTPLARKPVPAPLVEEEEVRIPAWLAPISQSSNSTAVAPAASATEEADSTSAVSVNSEESFDALVVDAPLRSEVAVFGGQLLGESAATAEHGGTSSSKKGLFIGLAAAVILALAGGGWYYWQNFSSSTTTAASHPANISSSAAPAVVSNSSAVVPAPAPATSSVNPSAAAPAPASLQPAKNPPSSATQPVTAPGSEAKTSNSTAHDNVAAVESQKKPDLGDVHLAAPVVNRSADTQQAADMPAIESNASSAGSDPLADVHRKEPAVPLPVGGEVRSAQLIKSVSPVYPPMAKSQRLSGNVQIDALIDASGNVASMKVLSGPPVLHKAALDAVRQWKYSPALLDGEPTSMHLTVTVQFRNQ